MTLPEIACLGLGSNLGDRQTTIENAVMALRLIEGVEVIMVSRLIETEPVGPIPQDPYLNGAMKIRTTVSPRDLLDICLRIEREAGRDRVNEQRWGPRRLDLDLLLFGDQVIDEPGLHVPHPRMHERGFVLIPLSEITPSSRHPGLGLTIQALRERLVIAT